MLRGVAVDHARTRTEHNPRGHHQTITSLDTDFPLILKTPKHDAVFHRVSWQHALDHPSAIRTAWEDIEQTRMLIVEEQDGLSPSTRLALHRTCTRSYHLHRWATHRRPHYSVSLTQ